MLGRDLKTLQMVDVTVNESGVYIGIVSVARSTIANFQFVTLTFKDVV